MTKISFLATALLITVPLFGAEQQVDYERDIKPILKARCYSCHGALKQESGLRLDTGRFIQQGGENGPARSPFRNDEVDKWFHEAGIHDL